MRSKTFVFICILVVCSAVGGLVSLKTYDQRATPSQQAESLLQQVLPTPSPLPMTIPGIRQTVIETEALKVIEKLPAGSNYSRSLAEYRVNGLRIQALLTVPTANPPEGGYPAIVFLHGYIPPSQYQTTERYVAYVDALARSGFVVLKIDYRGHGASDGQPGGAYYSPDYVLDTLAAIEVLKNYPEINPERLGLWGHSMSGNVALRTAVVSDDVQAVSIWAGAVYSYEDFAKYRLNDNSYQRPTQSTPAPLGESRRSSRQIVEEQGEMTLASPFWQQMAPVSYLSDLDAAIQLHHAENDTVVNIGYSRDLAEMLAASDKKYELYEYSTGGHDIEGASFSTAMQRTLQFFTAELQ